MKAVINCQLTIINYKLSIHNEKTKNRRQRPEDGGQMA
jgi:hypothetical protein